MLIVALYDFLLKPCHCSSLLFKVPPLTLMFSPFAHGLFSAAGLWIGRTVGVKATLPLCWRTIRSLHRALRPPAEDPLLSHFKSQILCEDLTLM